MGETERKQPRADVGTGGERVGKNPISWQAIYQRVKDLIPDEVTDKLIYEPKVGQNGFLYTAATGGFTIQNDELEYLEINAQFHGFPVATFTCLDPRKKSEMKNYRRIQRAYLLYGMINEEETPIRLSAIEFIESGNTSQEILLQEGDENIRFSDNQSPIPTNKQAEIASLFGLK
ncbi:hypothetical protein HYT02_00270 [Candidatus Gottesmanbacteria bacterium]|nr:hypothetical protein [Candidatus Gottesmanbacteria bacterium]